MFDQLTEAERRALGDKLLGACARLAGEWDCLRDAPASVLDGYGLPPEAPLYWLEAACEDMLLAGDVLLAGAR